MWGCSSTDNLYQPNFSTGFSSMKSDIIIHLAQWQYWWWFWFSFVWTLYFFFINRALRVRVLKMRPKINTSYRSHGKWGDFLACIVPIIWCLNILTNSSFILRLMEWQNESSLFTIRIRGRQWYWVYKFELRHVVDIMSAPKNIGTNRWVISTGGSIETTDNYLYAIKLRSQNAWLKNYWDSYVKNFIKYSNLHTDSFLDTLDYSSRKLTKANLRLRKFFVPFRSPRAVSMHVSHLGHSPSLHSAEKFSTVELFVEPNFAEEANSFSIGDSYNLFFDKKWFCSAQKNRYLNLNSGSFFLKKFSTAAVEYVNFSKKKFDNFETSRFHKRLNVSHQPILISKAFLDLEKSATWEKKNYDVINVFFNKEKSFVKKVPNEQTFLVLKQKRYKRKKLIPQRMRFLKNADDFKAGGLKFSDRPAFVSTNFLDSIQFDPSKLYRSLKKNKVRHEDMPVQLSRRLLRTKKTLVLPAHVNLTVITNSYDVVHSWFIPALGVKLDCVPGRSTHHVFYCDSVGFYYGQCAEICGRYHHHMPIRICALPFEHFVVWWQHFGLNKLLYSFNKKSFESKFAGKTFVW